MTRIKRPAAAVGAAVLLSFSLTACGGAPTDASKDDFCEAYGGVFEKIFAVSGDEPTEDEWEEVQDAVGELEDVGTPDGISDDERNGFEVFVEAIADADYDDIKDSEDGEIPGVSEDDDADAEKFFAYATKTCPDALGIPTDLPTDIPTDLPTELPTDLPTEIPTDLLTDLSDLTELPSELSDLTEIPTS